MLNHLFKPLRTPPKAVPPPPVTVNAEERSAICTACGFNVDWVCEHSGCKICPGKARQLGANPLKTLLTRPQFKCPMRKF